MSILSVIVPVYNAEKYIDRCVESLAAQTYTDLEIILVNDGSTDSSGTKCDQWAEKDNRIKVIHKENGGVASARNAGLDAATGDYIIFAHADSIFENDIISKCISEIKAHSPDLLVCAIEADSSDMRSKIYLDTNLYTRYEYAENIARYISTGVGFGTISNKVFASYIIKGRNMRFNEEMPLVAEELFTCRYFTTANHIRCISCLLCRHADSTAVEEGTTEYLAQGKVFSQALIDAVQSKGLYNAASSAIGENYQKILYKHLVLLSQPSEKHTLGQRADALDALSRTSDSAPLMVYLATLPGIKNRYIYQTYKLRQWKLLLTFLGK